MARDSLEFDIPSIKRDVEVMVNLNQDNSNIKAQFLEYVNGKLASEWTTAKGEETIKKLNDFIENDFQSYIDYLKERTDQFNDEVVPRLEKIDNA